MKDETKKFTDRFSTLFKEEGVTNVKFFVRNADNCTLPGFIQEVNKIQDTIAAGDWRQIDSIDKDAETKPYDAPF